MSPAGSAIGLPPFCRVAATLRPSNDSDIKIEVWMPAAGWNGKLVGEGNGGWAGSINTAAMAEPLQHGYATAGTDTGHTGNPGNGSFSLGHPEKLIDFGWRSQHEMTVAAKAVVAAFYGNGPRRSYWEGCSTGGRQGLKEAQRFPEDYDGIVAGAPANPFTLVSAANMYVGVAALKDPASNIPASKYPLVHDAVLNACDALDGVKDGLLTDPTRCRFDPAALQCKGDDGPMCLTAPQVETVRKIYGPVKNPRTGRQYSSGLEPGTELRWNVLAGGPQPFSAVVDYFRYVVHRDPNWDWRSIDFDKDVEAALKTDNGLLDAVETNLGAFTRRGGKLLMFHGWADQNIAPRNTIDYVKRVQTTMGGADKTASSLRLFMAPGMGHCRGGEGPSTIDWIAAIDAWVEQGKAPERITATHLRDGKPDRTRPLCPYPQNAVYRGAGSTDAAENFVCKP